MAVGLTETKTVGRVIVHLERGEDTTTRTLDVAYPKTEDGEGVDLQALVDTINSTLTSTGMKYFIQPANWRDTNVQEEQWTTTLAEYEIVTTSTTPITPSN